MNKFIGCLKADIMTRLAIVLLTGCIAATSCTDEVPPLPLEEIYTREFVKRFGTVDRTHSWNGAQRSTIQVSAGAAPATVTVSGIIDGERYLLARYDNVEGTRTLSFDMPEGCDSLSVSDGRNRVMAKPGQHVNLSVASRAIWDEKTDPNDIVKVSRDPYITLSDEAIRSFGLYLPEGQNNVGKVVQNFSYVSKGPFTIYPVFWNTRMFNTLGIYYINNEGTAAEEIVYVPFYTNKISPIDNTPGNILYQPADAAIGAVEARWNNATSTYVVYGDTAPQWVEGRRDFSEFDEADWAAFEKEFVTRHADPATLAWAFDFSFIPAGLPEEARKQIRVDDIRYRLDHSDGWRTNVIVTAAHTTASAAFVDDTQWVYPGQSFCSYPDYDTYIKYLKQGLSEEQMAARGFKFPLKWQSRGIRVDILPGTRFGLYIRTEDKAPGKNDVDVVSCPIDPATGLPVSDGYTRYYSESRLNRDMMSAGGTNTNAVHAATYRYMAPNGKTYHVLGFEDWGGNGSGGSDLDLNDMMFFIDGEVDVTDQDPGEAIEWIVACEDLGATEDFDFNDVVFSVRHVSGSRVASVTPLAAGGTLQVYLCHTGPDGVERVVGDVEWHMLFDEYDHTTIINTTTLTHSSRIYDVPVDEDFTLSPLFHDSNGENLGATQLKTNMGGFHVRVKRNDGSTDDIAPPAYTGAAPQMFLIPQLASGSSRSRLWEWARERRSIEYAYPQFREWIKDSRQHGNWHIGEKNPEHTVRR